MQIDVIDNSMKVIDEMHGKRYLALDAVGKAVLYYVDVYVPKDTGNLALSMTHQVDDDEVIVGTDVKYGKYVEYDDTKTHAEPTRAHFLRDAVFLHEDEYKQLLKYQLTL